ncbi:MAG: hypothetical protein RL038_393 [Actinomycetota bacterium]
MAEKKDSIDPQARLREILPEVAPGTALRDGLERILRGRTGGLIVLGFDKSVEEIAGGGFALDVEFSATRLRELAKMDGAIIVDPATNRIVRAAVQLLPDPTLPTNETGTRHRTADRASKQTGVPVISVSKSMNIIALYTSGNRYVLEETPAILSRANQAIATLERYRARFDQVSANLSALEVEDLVTARDLAVYLQRIEMVRRIHAEISTYVVELGIDGRLIALQAEELVSGIEQSRRMVIQDYAALTKKSKTVETYLSAIDALSSEDFLDLNKVIDALGITLGLDGLDESITARGHRLLARLPRISETMHDRIISHFKQLPALLVASTEDLQKVEGIGETRARSIRDGLTKITEAAILERLL